MKRISLLSIAILAVGLLGLAAAPALADSCAALGGNLVLGECRITGAAPGVPPNNRAGVFSLDETLRITSGGIITVPKLAGGNTLTINITGGLIMEVGSKIIGDVGASPNDTTAIGAAITINTTGDILLAGDGTAGSARISSEQQAGSAGSGRGGNITLTSSDGKITTEYGSVISANALHNPAGDIVIRAPKGLIDVDGQVLSQSGLTGTGPNQRPGGGRITIIGCNIIVSDTGLVSSKGADPGADLVHLEACTVDILGKVESTGSGHAIPNNPPNHCNLDPIAHPIGGGPSTAFTGCVEVWSGTTITVFNDGGLNNGEINADIGITGGTNGRGWIDLFANKDISLTGAGPYAVHSNGGLGQTNDDGGLITVKSISGDVLTAGLAIQANATSSGSKGGDVIVQAANNVSFGMASIQAKGATTGGGPQAGGHINGRAFNGLVSGSAPGELNAAGGGAPGSVTLQGCGTAAPGDGVAYTGTVTPSPAILPLDACGGSPTISVILPSNCDVTGCSQLPPPPCEKAAVQSVLNPITGRFPGNAGPDLTFRLDLGHDEDGNTSIQQSVDNVTDKNSDGYLIIMVVKDDSGQLGGSTFQKVDISHAYTRTFALFGCSVTLNDPDVHDGLPAGLIEVTANSPAHVAPPAPGNIFVMDLHGNGSDVAGWKVVGDGRYMRNVATSNSAVGMWFLGNNNTMHNGNGNDNTGSGILVQGNSNLVDSSDAFGNGGNGVTVVGTGNTVKKVDAGDKGKGNTEDGVRATGNSNIISEVDAFANGGNGIWVSGNSNQLLKNNAGDKGKGNLLEGIHLAGASNLFQENSAYANGGNGMSAVGSGNTLNKNDSGDRADKANGGDGFLLGGGSTLTENKAVGNLGNGFRLTTSGFSLKKNVSGNSGSGYANGLCQYKFDVAGNLDAGSNKSNNVAIAGTGSPKAFAAGCK